MKLELKKIASVQMGYSFRTRLELVVSGNIAVIQMKDLTDGNNVDCSGLSRVEAENLKRRHFVKLGDLVFRSRGNVTTSVILTEDPGEAVVAAPLLRVRVTHKAVLPEYLNWFINQPPTQAFLATRAIGTAQKMISKEALESVEVLVPSLDYQRAIVEIAALAAEEQNLIRKLADKRRQYVSIILTRLAQGE